MIFFPYEPGFIFGRKGGVIEIAERALVGVIQLKKMSMFEVLSSSCGSLGS